MKKFFVFCLILALFLSCLTFIGCGKTENNETPNTQVPCIMYQGALYRTTGELVLDVDVDESMIVGEITSVVHGSELPAKNGEANFGEVGMIYALVEEGLVVRINNCWYLYVLGFDE